MCGGEGISTPSFVAMYVEPDSNAGEGVGLVGSTGIVCGCDACMGDPL